MFQFPGFAFYPYVFRIKYLHNDNRKSEAGNPQVLPRSLPASKFQLSKVGFPIRKSAGQRLFAPHHSLSQRTTSFIASYRQGIHQMPLGHLIALISNARRFTIKPTHRWRMRQLSGYSARRALLRKTRSRDKPSECSSRRTQCPRRISSLRCPLTSSSSPHFCESDETCSLQRLLLCPLISPASPWWSQTGSNRRPPACKAGALPAELWPLFHGAPGSRCSIRAVDTAITSLEQRGGPGKI